MKRTIEDLEIELADIRSKSNFTNADKYYHRVIEITEQLDKLYEL